MSSSPPPLPSAADAEGVSTDEQPPSAEEKQLSSSFEKIHLTDVGHPLPTDTSGVVHRRRKSKILADVKKSVAKLESSDYFRRFLSLFDTKLLRNNLPRSLPNNHFQLVAYGVGSIEESYISRLQLSLAILLLRKLPTDLRPQIFDPVFNATECAALEDLGFSVIPFNELGCRIVQDTHTLFYMPKCPQEIANNLLIANWHPEHLLKMTVLGDTFRPSQFVRNSILRHGGKRVEDVAPYVLTAGNFCTAKEMEVSVGKDNNEIIIAFHLLMWHFFKKKQLKMWAPTDPTHLPFRKEKTPRTYVPEAHPSTST